MSGIDIDDVEPRVARSDCSLPVPAAEVANVGLVHRAGLEGVASEVWQAVHIHRNETGELVRGSRSAVPEFSPGKRAVRVHGIRHQPVCADVVVVPERCRHMG